jgi:hypothetical protein
MLVISSYSLIGQVPVENIKRANSIYLTQVQQIDQQRTIILRQQEQITELSLAYDNCMEGFHAQRQITAQMGLQLRQKDNIIRSQSTMIKILSGIATTAVGFVVYRELN